MNQSELIAAVTAKTDLSIGQTKSLLKILGDVVQTEIQKGEGAEVTLPGIGKISVKQTPARIGRNPATGAEISIPAKNKPHFSASKALKGAAMCN